MYRNVDAANPVDVIGGAGAVAASLTIPSVAAHARDRLVWAGSAFGTAGTWTPPTGMTATVAKSGGTTDAAMADQTLTADGATGARSGTHSTNTALSGALIALKPAATTFGYDPRGNRTSRTETDGSWTVNTFDNANELTGYGTTTTYKYNGDGIRASKTVGAATTPFTWDPTSGLPAMISDGTASYVYGPTGQPLQRTTSSGSTYYQHDLLGSTRALTDAAGTVQATYTYDAFGRTTSTTGTDPNPLRYNGQYQDPESSFYYLRARYYDPETANFISRDPLDAITASPYNYANNNPTNLTDPSGACPVCIIVGVALLAGEGNLLSQAFTNPAVACDPLHEANWGSVARSAGEAGLFAAGGEAIGAAVALRGFGAAAKSGDETVSLFRNVDGREFDSIAETGKFSTGAGKMEGKWFATTGEHADQWGGLLNRGQGLTVETRVPKSLADQLHYEQGKLDGVGPGYYADGGLLDAINGAMDGIRLWR